MPQLLLGIFTDMRRLFLIQVLSAVLFTNCSDQGTQKPLFVSLTAEQSGIDFTNTLEYDEQLNPYTFKNFYNGGGVAVGDLNNDGLAEIFFSGNMVSNRLYLNKGNLNFQDITDQANLNSQGTWSTGVSMIDINADGFLDIYVCKSGPPGGPERHNHLYINNGDLTFTEQAKSYGLDIEGLSVHAIFFDYDRDGDLDCYVLNNSIKSIGSFEIMAGLRTIPDSLGGNKLLRNNNGYFNDVTSTSGIYSSDIGFGLGATVGDINNDGWPDLYISNDFFEKDYLYINQQDGTFKDLLEQFIQETSMGSMGADLADINNDGFPEYFVTEMLPERRDRQVTKTYFESWEEQKSAQGKGYFNQFGRNVLQLNNGDGTFSEIGRYAGVEATDWSWASLIFDMDNDGYKDIFVSNGIFKDLLDLDYLNFMSDRNSVANLIRSNNHSIRNIIDLMPSEAIPNYFFHNNGDLTFTNRASQWNVGSPTFSNGSAYGDLDNDGDLDLVVNNINMISGIYENKARQVLSGNSFLAIQLTGNGANPRAIGTKIHLYINGETLHQEQNPYRGFESSVDYKLVFGLGANHKIDSITVIWPGGKTTRLVDVNANQVLELNESTALPGGSEPLEIDEQVFSRYSEPSLDFRHLENNYVDFQQERLLFHMNSTEGPCLCKGDINNDGRDDLYIGGASGQPGKLFIQTDSMTFTTITHPFRLDAESEDLDCSFFDANNDGLQDLYVTSGGSEFSSFSPWLNDRLYFGDANGGFVKSEQRLPYKGYESTSTVVPVDFDQDGDQDLFIGSRLLPFYYGVPADSYLLENNGSGQFTIFSDGSAEILKQLGMVTDATLADVDGDGGEELVVVGRWMPVTMLKFSSDGIIDITGDWDLQQSNGWYNTVEAKDLNRDGRADLIVGNHGLNSRFKASKEEPVEMLVNDFDNSGSYEQIISMYSGGKQYPFIQLKEMATQLPQMSQQYQSYSDYKEEETGAIFPQEIRDKGFVLQAYNLASGIYINQGDKFKFQPLPAWGQFSPVYALKAGDFDRDGLTDILVGGNFIQSKPEVGSYSAGFGALFKGLDNGAFEFVPNSKAGFQIYGAIRNVVEIKVGNKNVLVFTRNNDTIYSMAYVNHQ